MNGKITKFYNFFFSSKSNLEDIKKYFGESVALYFSFLEYYTRYLIPPAIFGLLHSFMFVWDSTDNDNIIFAIMNVIWATVFLELWKRKGATIVHSWGRLDMQAGITSIFSISMFSMVSEVGSTLCAFHKLL